MTAAYETDWRAHGACVSADPDLFFPISSTGAGSREEHRAKAICAVCHVRAECLAFAVESRQVHGIWGGLSEIELRRLMRRNRRTAAPARPHEQMPLPRRVSKRDAGQRIRQQLGAAEHQARRADAVIRRGSARRGR